MDKEDFLSAVDEMSEIKDGEEGSFEDLKNTMSATMILAVMVMILFVRQMCINAVLDLICLIGIFVCTIILAYLFSYGDSGGLFGNKRDLIWLI